MPEVYEYELWNGKKVVGYYRTLHKLYGKVLIIHELSPLKQPYGRKIKTIEIKLAYRTLISNGVDTIIRHHLDVRNKSKRQIEIIKKSGY